MSSLSNAPLRGSPVERHIDDAVVKKTRDSCASVSSLDSSRGPVPKFLMELEDLRGFGRGGGGSSESFMSDHETLNREQVMARLQRRSTAQPDSREWCPFGFAKEKDVDPSMTNEEKAGIWKENGNMAFRRGDLWTAIKHYTTCIELEPENEIFYSNRAAAYDQVCDYEKSMLDAEKVVELNPSWAKGWARLGMAQYERGLYRKALLSYEKALEIEPTCSILIHFYKKTLEEEKLQREEGDEKRKSVQGDDVDHRSKQDSTETVTDTDKGGNAETASNNNRKKSRKGNKTSKPLHRKWIRII